MRAELPEAVPATGLVGARQLAECSSDLGTGGELVFGRVLDLDQSESVSRSDLYVTGPTREREQRRRPVR